MAVEREIAGHSYVFDVDYGEEAAAARIIVRCADGGTEGLFLVFADGSLEPADDLPGFGPNPASRSGLWPEPPEELIADARKIAELKGADG